MVVVVGFLGCTAWLSILPSRLLSSQPPCGVNSSVIKRPPGSDAFHNADGLFSFHPPSLPPSLAPPPRLSFLWLPHRPESLLSCSSAQLNAVYIKSRELPVAKALGVLFARWNLRRLCSFFLFLLLTPTPIPLTPHFHAFTSICSFFPLS